MPQRIAKAGLPGGRVRQPLVAVGAHRATGRGVAAVVRAATAEAAPETFTYQAEVRGGLCVTSTTEDGCMLLCSSLDTSPLGPDCRAATPR